MRHLSVQGGIRGILFLGGRCGCQIGEARGNGLGVGVFRRGLRERVFLLWVRIDGLERAVF